MDGSKYIYIEHVIKETELVESINPQLTQVEVGPSSYRGCDFDENIGGEDRED